METDEDTVLCSHLTAPILIFDTPNTAKVGVKHQ